jgi:hypothetical protein
VWAAQAIQPIDAEIEKKGYLWTETRYLKVRTALMPPSTEMI